jgi:hypothetical protein
VGVTVFTDWLSFPDIKVFSEANVGTLACVAGGEFPEQPIVITIANKIPTPTRQLIFRIYYLAFNEVVL